ncbi:TVP38/TMEM64 family protein [endosymbiont of Riftia pachyptila]|uniref:TVP38/TMEM64 family protein n=1 Tax=endosymbiont of Riftia pachyptila TaxID=54396 RepID=UPI0002F90F95
MTLAGGALFGPVLGTFYNLTGATIGAVLAFLIARFFTSNWVEQKTGGHLKRLKEGVENEGWRFVAFVRLVPLFPFNLLNYAVGPDPYPAASLPDRHLSVHAARRHCLHLSRIRRA